MKKFYKNLTSDIFELTKINKIFFMLQKKFYSNKFLRAINYHGINKDDKDNFEDQLKFFSNYFSDVDKQDLNMFLNENRWNKQKPGLIITFDDGYESHFTIAKPLLEKYNFTGWFFVPAIFPEKEKQGYMTWEQIRELSKKHVIGSHTLNHFRIKQNFKNSIKITNEIVISKNILENKLKHKIDVFAWVGGEEKNYNTFAAKIIKNNYIFSFMTNSSLILPNTNNYQLQRTNIEANYQLPLVKLFLSGIVDLYYLPKRKRVNKLTNV